MKLCAKEPPNQLLQMLRTALQRQRDKWTRCVYQRPVNQEVEVSPEQRDEIVRWIVRLNCQFSFYPETLFLSVAILDKFLHSVKVRPKYLRCVGITCFYLGAKTCEEDEVVPATSELVEESDCGRTVSEVLRMERVILDKLNWDLNLATPLDFIHILHALTMSRMPHLLDGSGLTPSRQLAMLTTKLVRCVSHHTVAVVPPSILATSLLSLELQTLGADWLRATTWLQSLTQADSHSLIHCREKLASFLFIPSHTGVTTPTHLAPLLGGGPAVVLPPMFNTADLMTSFSGAIKRKVEQMEVDDENCDPDDMYDGIQRLYNEDCEQQVALASLGAICAAGVSTDAITSPRVAAAAN